MRVLKVSYYDLCERKWERVRGDRMEMGLKSRRAEIKRRLKERKQKGNEKSIRWWPNESG